MTNESDYRTDKIMGLLAYLEMGKLPAEEVARRITALFAPKWRRYPENVPTEGGTHRVTIRSPKGLLQSSFDGWGGVDWETFGKDNGYFTVIAFAELGDVEPFNPEHNG